MASNQGYEYSDMIKVTTDKKKDQHAVFMLVKVIYIK